MPISTKRFIIRIENHIAIIRDAEAPYHLHRLAAVELPPLELSASMTEDQYNNIIMNLIYTKESTHEQIIRTRNNERHDRQTDKPTVAPYGNATGG